MKFTEVPESNWFKFKTTGDVIEGTVDRVWTQTGGQYGDQKVVDVRTSDGALWSVGAAGDMKAKVQKLAAGQYVRLTYVGDRQGNTGAFKSIKVEVGEGTPPAGAHAPAAPAANGEGGKAPF